MQTPLASILTAEFCGCSVPSVLNGNVALAGPVEDTLLYVDPTDALGLLTRTDAILQRHHAEVDGGLRSHHPSDFPASTARLSAPFGAITTGESTPHRLARLVTETGNALHASGLHHVQSMYLASAQRHFGSERDALSSSCDAKGVDNSALNALHQQYFAAAWRALAWDRKEWVDPACESSPPPSLVWAPSALPPEVSGQELSFDETVHGAFQALASKSLSRFRTILQRGREGVVRALRTASEEEGCRGVFLQTLRLQVPFGPQSTRLHAPVTFVSFLSCLVVFVSSPFLVFLFLFLFFPGRTAPPITPMAQHFRAPCLQMTVGLPD